MKTKTNFQKAAIRSAAVVVSFILVSFTVSAQEFWKKLLTNSSFNEIAIAMVETNTIKGEVKGSGVYSADWKSFDMAFDPALELEGWMSSGEYFGVKPAWLEKVHAAPAVEEVKVLDLEYLSDAGEPLKLEAWMVQDNVWIR